jgi:hypothetical protein
MARSSAVADDDGIEAAADALAAMSMRLPELPDLPEHLEYLVRDTYDGPEVVIVPSSLSDVISTMADIVTEANEEAPPFMDTTDSSGQVQEPTIVTDFNAQIEPQTVVDLNRFNFYNSVLREGHDQPEHWIIRFCHDWYEPCDQLTPIFKQSALEVDKVLNANTQFQATVRFADVDCSTNKPLCNEVADYHFPQIIHFHKQKRLNDWKGGGNKKVNAERYLKWVANQAERIKSGLTAQKKTIEVVRKMPAIAPLQWDLKHVIALFTAMAGALAGYFWILVRKITCIDCHSTRAKLPSTTLLRHNNRIWTCHDMYPDDWLLRHSESEAVVEL